MPEMNDVLELAISDNYKLRFFAEYWQTKIRYEKLKALCNRIEAARITVNPAKEPHHDCPLELLREQQNIMGNYLRVLELRAAIEEIELQSPCLVAENR